MRLGDWYDEDERRQAAWCPECNGEGITDGETCDVCGGSGLKVVDAGPIGPRRDEDSR